MTTTELIKILQKSLEINGDLKVVGVCNGFFYEYVDTNVEEYKNYESVLYIELAE